MIEKQIDVLMLSSLEELFAQITADTAIILTRENTPFAQITHIQHPRQPKPERILDLHAGMWISVKFDDVLPKEFWSDNL